MIQIKNNTKISSSKLQKDEILYNKLVPADTIRKFSIYNWHNARVPKRILIWTKQIWKRFGICLDLQSMPQSFCKNFFFRRSTGFSPRAYMRKVELNWSILQKWISKLFQLIIIIIIIDKYSNKWQKFQELFLIKTNLAFIHLRFSIGSLVFTKMSARKFKRKFLTHQVQLQSTV